MKIMGICDLLSSSSNTTSSELNLSSSISLPLWAVIAAVAAVVLLFIFII